MTDRPMDASTAEHPDEGLIHAWLDDALSAAEAARLAAHVQGCAECQARVAEARGLIGGASRIVAALDGVPAGTRPGWAQSATVAGGAAADGPQAQTTEKRQPQGSVWRWLRVTPGRAALAATILVALGITLTHERVAEDSVRSVRAVIDPQRADAPAATSAEGGASDGAKEPAPRDELLDSAVARNLAQTQGQARIEAAPGPTLPQAPPPSAAFEGRAGAGAEQVAMGRAATRAQRDTANVAADRLRVGNSAEVADASTTVGAGGVTGAVARPSASAPTAGAMMAKQRADAVARSCFRVDSPDPDARWADQPFPFVVALDSGSAGGARAATVLTVVGEPTQIRATWSPRGEDSVTIGLRRIGYSGSIVLGPGEFARNGVAMSAAAPTALEGVVVATAPTAQSRARPAGEREEARRSAAAPPAPAASQPTPAPGPPIRQLRVLARSIPCPR